MIESAIVFWLWGMMVCLAVLSLDFYVYARVKKGKIHSRGILHLLVSSVFWSWLGVALIVSDWLSYFLGEFLKRHKY